MNIENFLQQGEGQFIEFKESLDKSLASEIVAFANASGGKIFLGVNDAGVIKGISITNKLKSQIQDIARNMNPSFHVHIEQIKDLGIIYVLEGKEKPYTVNGHFYIRQGANSQQLNRDEIRTFFQKENLISFEKKINEKFEINKHFNEKIYNNFLEISNIPKTLSRNHVLKNLNLLTDDKINNACVLMFATKVTDFFLSADISCVLYKGTTKVSMLDKKEFDEDLFSNFNNALLFIERNIKNKAEIIGSKRVEELEIPREVLREAILNAIVHRDYFIESRILIDIFDDRIEITNPGKLLIKEEELGKLSILRNPIIADLFQRNGLIEKIGSGILRMKTLFPKIQFEIYSNFFKLILQRESSQKDLEKDLEKLNKNQEKILLLIKNNPKINTQNLAQKVGSKLVEKVGSKLVEKVGSKLVETQIKILLLMEENPRITKLEIASTLKLSTTAIDKNILKLKELKLLKRIGPDKGGHWEIK